MDEVMATLEQIVRVGTVSSVNIDNRTARVKFSHLGDMVSGNLRVLQQYACEIHVEPDNEHRHTDGEGNYTSYAGSHNHNGTYTTFWMPSIGDTVLCLYLPVFNGDGVVLGVLK